MQHYRLNIDNYEVLNTLMYTSLHFLRLPWLACRKFSILIYFEDVFNCKTSTGEPVIKNCLLSSSFPGRELISQVFNENISSPSKKYSNGSKLQDLNLDGAGISSLSFSIIFPITKTATTPQFLLLPHWPKSNSVKQ